MNSIFHDMIGHHIEVYIDDIVVKSKQADDHIEHLRKSFQRMRQHELKLNPFKCAFGVKAENFLGFLVHQRGVEVDKNKEKAIMEANPPRNKKELQCFLVQVNYLRRFISNLARKMKEFSQLLKLKDIREFKWEDSLQKDFDVIKRYLSNPHVLMPLRPILSGRIGKWSLALAEFTLIYYPQKSVKGQAIADFLADHPSLDEPIGEHASVDSEENPLFDSAKRDSGRYAQLGYKLSWKGLDGLLLRCIGFPEVLEIMKQVHEEVCGAHQSGVKMTWLIRRYGYYWLSILKDCIKYAKGCQPCQKHGNIQRIPTDELHSVVKPWLFKGWAMDLVGKIYLASSKGHSFILVATNFLTKWVEAMSLKKVEQGDVINFVKENIIHRFGIPESLTTD
ncbi:uncharacterized protein [Primulina huaijiensis]|uniref:uncharacterized protein n=1 Tax=Primulina huaijiensis TaxID=1492673 RepID=UPI003CC70D6A